MEISGGIEEASYGLVRGKWKYNNGSRGPVRLVLRINGKDLADICTSDESFELDAGRVILPNDSLDVLVFDSSGRQAARFPWGDIDRPLPDPWMNGNTHRYPSFFVLGAAKSGTTSLHLHLDQHPEIFMSKPKEPFFFESEYERGGQFYYNKYFGGWKGEKAVGESRHRNLYFPYVPARISSYNPRAKLVALLRNPAERAVSHWWHWRSRNLEPLSAKAAFDADLERIRAGLSVETPEEIALYARELKLYARGQHRTYIDSGYYLDQLQRYLRFFPREQLHVLLFDEYIAQPVEGLRGLFRFLEVSEGVAPLVDARHFNNSIPGMWEHVDERLWAELTEHYRPHNRRLEEFLGRSLASWDSARRPSV